MLSGKLGHEAVINIINYRTRGRFLKLGSVMSNIQNILVTLSLVTWLVLVVFYSVRKEYNLKGIFFRLFAVFASAFILFRYFGYLGPKVQFMHGTTTNHYLIVLGLYISTILGVLGNHLFVQIKDLNAKGRKPKIKWPPVFKPLIISPLIFIATLHQIELTTCNEFGWKVLMAQFIFAFQNGFFWKSIIVQYEKRE